MCSELFFVFRIEKIIYCTVIKSTSQGYQITTMVHLFFYGVLILDTYETISHLLSKYLLIGPGLIKSQKKNYKVGKHGFQEAKK